MEVLFGNGAQGNEFTTECSRSKLATPFKNNTMKLKAKTKLHFQGKSVKKGEVYEVSDSLGQNHLACDFAEKVDGTPKPEKPSAK